mmetsp:Transcript_19946/g.37547  ORF Transcript_19946/g.37547 Transcript_19946/m.37547 type:complete len:208 (+) Transcript_19946:3774-4397(+)
MRAFLERLRKLRRAPPHHIVLRGQAGIPGRYARHVHGVGLTDRGCEFVHANADREYLRLWRPLGAAQTGYPLCASGIVDACHHRVGIQFAHAQIPRYGIQMFGGGSGRHLRLTFDFESVLHRQCVQCRANSSGKTRIFPHAGYGPRAGLVQCLDGLGQILGGGGERSENGGIVAKYRRGGGSSCDEYGGRGVGVGGHLARETGGVGA